MATTVISVRDLGGDVIQITGTVSTHTATRAVPALDAGGQPILDAEGNPVLTDETYLPEVVALGWLSALTNHFPAADYNPDGSRKAGRTARAMTRAEKLAYCKARLADAVPLDPAAPVGTDLGLAG